MNKKALGGLGIFLIVFGVIALGLLGTLTGMYYKAQSAIADEDEEAVVGLPGVTEAISFCANNPDVDWEVRAKDLLTATASYRAGEVYLVDTYNGQVIVEKNITSTSSARSDLTDAFKCGHSYAIEPKVSQDTEFTAWAEPLILSASETVEDPVIKDIEVKRNTGAVKIRCYDNLLRGSMYDADGVVATTYKAIAHTTDINFTSTTNGSNTALANDEEFDVTCQIKTNSADYQAGLNAWLGLDHSDTTDTGDWVADDFLIDWEGANVPSTLPSANDLVALTGNELFYKLSGGVEETTKELRIRGVTDGSATIDRDLVFRLCFTGTYLSNMDDSQLLRDVCFRDDGSTRTEIVTATARQFRFLID